MKTRLSFIHRWVMGMTLSVLTCGAMAQAAPKPETAPPKLTLTCRDAYCLISAQKTQVTLSVSGKRATPGDYQLKYQLAGWDGEMLNQKSIDLQLPGEFNQDIEFVLARYGSYTLTVSLADPQGQEIASGKLRLVRPVPVPVLTRAQRRNSSIGVNAHAYAKWDALAKMGIHWARDYASGRMGQAENLPFGGKDMPNANFKEIYDHVDELGITILPCMQQGFRTPDLKYFISDTEKIAACYEELSKAFPEIEFWELDNEIDLQHRGNPLEFEKWFESYVACIQAAKEGLTRAGHGAKVVLNGDAGINYERTQRLLDLVGDDFSVCNFHFYTGTIPPEISRTDFNTNAENLLGASGFLDRMRAFSKLAHDHGKQAWLTEIGWDETNGPAVGERLQTLFLARMYLLARYCNVDKTFWFFDRDTNGTGIFSTCGLLNNDWNVRPIAASMAAVSKYTALADYVGSVDIGDDRWCLIFDDQGKWVVPVWSVHGEYALPEPLADAEMVDVFGNPVDPAQAKITPSVLYAFPKEIPAGWQQQTQAKWITDFGMVSFPGGTYDIKVELPENAKLVWNSLPEGVSMEAVDALQRIRVFSLTCSPEMPLGEYTFSATASGDGWQKNWAMDLRIIPPLQIRSDAYRPGEKSAVYLKTNAGQAQVDLNVFSRLGVVQPDAVKVSPSEEVTVEFQADESAAGPVKLTAKLATGAEQIAWLRPDRLNVPLLENITLDGSLADWPSEARLTSQAMALNSLEFDPTIYLGWGDGGLYLAARIPVRKIEAGRPDHFWDFPAVELFFNPSEEDAGEAWPITARQFFFTAVRKDDQWSVNVGQWKRNEAIPETIFTQPGAKTGIHIGEKEIVMEIFLPQDMLGAAPKENDTWKAAVTVQDATREEYHLEGDWPNFKNPYILDGVKGWGQLRFSPLTKVSRWEPNIQKFEERDRRNFPSTGETLFVGSSSIVGWNTQKYFPGIQTINRGFGGSQIADSIYYADRIILPYKPKTVVFYAGDNDIAVGKTPERVAEDFKTLTQLVHEELPETRILFVAIKPCIARWKMIDSVRKANTLIEAYTKTDDRLFYVDVDTLMTAPSGDMPSKDWFIKDGLHLSPMGYERWTALLMPYLSTFAENGRPAGTVDWGEDLNGVLFECNKGGWILAVWTTQGEQPIPAQLAEAKSFNAAGEPVEANVLTPQPTYFKLETLPAAWDAQRQAQWNSPKVMEIFPGGEISAAVSLPKDAGMSWGLLPEGVTASAWESKDDGTAVSTLEIAGQTAIGKYELTATAEGEGWQRVWKATLNIVAPIQVSSLPFFQDQPAEILLKANTDQPVEVSLKAPIGQITPDRLTVTPAGEKAEFSPPADTNSPLSLVVTTETGASVENWVRPGFLTISPAQAIVLDGKLDDWPETAKLAAHMMDGSEGYQPDTYLAWSESGLYVAAVIPATGPTSSDPNRWWAESNAEIFIDTSGQPEEVWAPTTRQFYFLPVKEQENWRLSAGEYIRDSDKGRSVYEDPRCKTAISVDENGYTLEMFIPVEALGQVPTTGSTWRLMVSLQRKNAEDTTDSAAWPVRKDKTSALAARYWGTAAFGN